MRLARWRTRVAALLVLLIPLPLFGLLWLAWHKPQPQPVPGADFIPMLDLEQRRALPTYQRPCNTDKECDPPLGCFYNALPRTTYCTDSICSKDEHCPDGFACRPRKTEGTARLIHTCILVGERKEGERCSNRPYNGQEACMGGLLCQGRCGRPCQLDVPTSCPEGFFCAEGRSAPPSCLPTCEGRTCPEGQQCISRGPRASICGRLHGEDCLQRPCPPGQECKTVEPYHRSGEIWRECVQSCDNTSPSTCPEGSVCYLFRCTRTCDPQAPTPCEPGFTCGRRHDTEPWRCRPE